MTQQPKPQGGAYGSGPSHQKEQHERLQELFNDLAVRRHQERKPAEETGTLYDHAQGDANTVGGRWAAQNRATLSGDKISVDYPTLPDASPWHAGNAVEPPLGFSIDEAPIVGEWHEVQASLRGDREASVQEPDADAKDGTDASELALPGAVPSTTLRRRKI
jgi:hypothetical protein